MAHEIEIKGKAQFDKLIKESTVPVIVDFWAEWCPPCKALKPVLEAKTEAAGGKWTLACVNVDEADNEELSQSLGINGIPHVFIFKNGEKVKDIVGNPQPKVLEEFLALAQ